MPNWCTQNLAITGEPAVLKKFADIVNSLPSRKLANESDFGPFWLGNLVYALGEEWENIPCRGAIADSGGWCGPTELSNGKLDYVEGDKILYVTFVSAWCPCYELLDLIRKRFPSFTIYHKETDEFGNFHTAYDPMRYLLDGKYYINTEELGSNYTEDIREFIGWCNQDMGTDIPLDCERKEAERLILEAVENIADTQERWIDIEIWDELDS